VNAITTGTDAQGEVTVRLSRDGRVMDGQGADTDIIVASAKAYLNALNKLRPCRDLGNAGVLAQVRQVGVGFRVWQAMQCSCRMG
jgi:hypothetical protein